MTPPLIHGCLAMSKMVGLSFGLAAIILCTKSLKVYGKKLATLFLE